MKLMIKGLHRQARKHIQATERSPEADKITNFDGRKMGEKKEEEGGKERVTGLDIMLGVLLPELRLNKDGKIKECQ